MILNKKEGKFVGVGATLYVGDECCCSSSSSSSGSSSSSSSSGSSSSGSIDLCPYWICGWWYTKTWDKLVDYPNKWYSTLYEIICHVSNGCGATGGENDTGTTAKVRATTVWSEWYQTNEGKPPSEITYVETDVWRLISAGTTAWGYASSASIATVSSGYSTPCSGLADIDNEVEYNCMSGEETNQPQHKAAHLWFCDRMECEVNWSSSSGSFTPPPPPSQSSGGECRWYVKTTAVCMYGSWVKIPSAYESTSIPAILDTWFEDGDGWSFISDAGPCSEAPTVSAEASDPPGSCT